MLSTSALSRQEIQLTGLSLGVLFRNTSVDPRIEVHVDDLSGPIILITGLLSRGKEVQGEWRQ